MLKTISINDVRLGMYIHELKGPWMDHPFWTTKFVLSEQEDFQKLKSCALKEVVIDTRYGLDILEEKATTPDHELTEKEMVLLELDRPQPPPPHDPPPKLTLDAERDRAAKIIESSSKAVKSMFQDLRMGKAIEAEAVMPIVEEISTSISRNAHALISLVRLKTVDDYTYMHSVAVCALMTALAKSLQLSEREVRQAGYAGLMHDVGKAAIPLEILNKPGSLTDDEFSIIRQHPVLGKEMLVQANITDPVTLDVCLHHHEKVDGSGYPDRLVGDQISIFSRMGAICDVYDAVTSVRAYKPAWEPGIALKRMASWQGHFDPVIFKAFIKSLGIFPIGTLVILKSGKLAVVVEQSAKSLLKPIVKAFFSTKSNMYIPVTELDLSKGMDEIVGHETTERWGIADIDHLWTNR